MSKHLRILNLLVIFILAFGACFAGGPVLPAAALSPDVVISQIYGGGGGTGASYTNDFIELYNRGTAPVLLTGWSVQYASATGTGNFGGNPIALLTGTLQPGQYYLVQQAGGTNGSPMPTPDATGAVNMSGSSGKVALITSTSGLACNGGSTPCSTAQLALIKDLVGYGTPNFYEGSGPAPTLSITTAAFRNGNGCAETDNNNLDFTAAAPAPRNTGTTIYTCPTSTNPSGTGAASPASLFPGSGTLLTVTVTPGTNPASSGLAVSVDLSAVGGSAAQSFFDNGTNGDVTVGDNVFSYSYTVPVLQAAGTFSLPASITDAQARSGSTSISLTVFGTLTPIHTIQGAAHLSPLNTTLVTTAGVVTGVKSNGFYIQDTNPDADIATSEGVLVFTSSAPAVNPGDYVVVTGTVKEYRPSGSSAVSSLTLTEIDNPGRTVTVMSTGNPLPAPVTIGAGGRVPPVVVIDDDGAGNIETGGVFDAVNDGIDFFESMEGMYVTISNAVAVGPTSNFTSNREIPVLVDGGANIAPGLRTPRGGVVIQPGNFNPERVILNDAVRGGPFLPLDANVGDSFAGPITGVIDYSFGNFKLEVSSLAALGPITRGGLQREVTPVVTHNYLTIGTFNVENLAPSDPTSKFNTLAALIVTNLRSPDILAIEEIQDNNGTTNDAVVAADVTWGLLIAAIQTAGGPTYQYRQIDPVDDQDGGAPGGNIRQGFLFRTDHGLSFVDRAGGTPTSANAVVNSGGPQLLYSPGRLDPANAAFNSSRKPLAAEFTISGRRLFVIGNHLNSKGGDDYLFGRYQPPTLTTEVQRMQQAAIITSFVQSILALDPNANVAVVGDLNDFQFSNPLNLLKTAPLVDLIETLPPTERYTYVYQGNSEVLDHIMFSTNLTSPAYQFQYDSLQVNSEFWDQASDHDPQLSRIFIQDPPVVANPIPNTSAYWGKSFSYQVPANTFADPNALLGDSLTYSATLGDGSALPAWLSFTPATRTFTGIPPLSTVGQNISLKVTATDLSSATAASTFTLTILNHAPVPTGTLPNVKAYQGELFVLTLGSGLFVDLDAPPDQISLSVSGLPEMPAWLTFDPDLRTFYGTPPVPGSIRTFTITVTATDLAGAKGHVIFDIQMIGKIFIPVTAAP